MTAVADYQDATAKNARESDEWTHVWATSALLGAVSKGTAIAKIVATINKANATAVGLADAYVAHAIEEQGAPALTLGLLPVDDSERLVQAVETISAEPEHQEMRLSRLARSEPLQTAHKSVAQAMTEQPLVEGWTREFDSDPCELCLYWWQSGRVWPKNHPFQTHHNCNCQPRIILVNSIKPVRRK